MLISPSEDFVNNTLAAVPGTFGKLKYVAGLRQGQKEYFHWGLARVHGEGTASLAISRAHSELFSEVLRSPIPSLWEEIRSTAADHGASTVSLIQELLSKKDALIPLDLAGGSRRHFKSVLVGLAGLAASLEERTDPAA